MTRRTSLKTAASVLLGGAPALAVKTPHKGGIKLSEVLSPGEVGRARLMKQMGVNHCIATVTGTMAKVPRDRYEEVLTKIRDDFKAEGIAIAGVESHPVPAEKIKLGAPGKEEELENYVAVIKALGKVGVPVLCYNWMAGLGWYRTNTAVPYRGGALTSEFDNSAAQKQGPTQWGTISEEKLWDNLNEFLKITIPVAEKAGVKMALHPDDPPLSPLRGIGRILTSAKNYRKVLDIVKSPVNGITFCQANFLAMGENIYDLANEWGKQKKIFFVHYRDIEGQREKFRETFHDNGPTDMAKILKIYSDTGFDGPIRPDHAPTMEGEQNDRPGYAMMGKVFAFGYMKGIMDAHRIPYE